MSETAVSEHTEWSDGRLDELARRVGDAASKDEMRSLRRELTERAEGVSANISGLRQEVRNLTGDPITEGRAKRTAIIVAIVGVLTGTGASSILYFLSGASPH